MIPAEDDAARNSRESEQDMSALLASATGQAQSEFERLYTSSMPALIAWVHVRTSGLQHSALDAEDIVQETWTRAFESFARFDPSRASFRAWVIGIAQHVLLDAMRRRIGRSLGGKSAVTDSGISQCPAMITSVSRAVARSDGIARFLEYVESLPSDDRDLVVLRGLESRSFEDIAERLRISFDAAEKRWQRLLAQLRERAVGRELVVEL